MTNSKVQMRSLAVVARKAEGIRIRMGKELELEMELELEAETDRAWWRRGKKAGF